MIVKPWWYDDDAYGDSIDANLHAQDDPGPVQTPEQEDERERRWSSFIGECREFASSERDGYSAVLRAVAEAMKPQQELFPEGQS